MVIVNHEDHSDTSEHCNCHARCNCQCRCDKRTLHEDDEVDKVEETDADS